MIRRSLLSLGVSVVLVSCQAELSFKAVTFEISDRDAVYEAVKSVVANYFAGVSIYEEAEAGRLETDYIYQGADPIYREKVYVVVSHEGATTKVEVLALVEEGKVEVDSPEGVTWAARGSDTKVEDLLLRSITDKIGAERLGIPPSSEQESKR